MNYKNLLALLLPSCFSMILSIGVFVSYSYYAGINASCLFLGNPAICGPIFDCNNILENVFTTFWGLWILVTLVGAVGLIPTSYRLWKSQSKKKMGRNIVRLNTLALGVVLFIIGQLYVVLYSLYNLDLGYCHPPGCYEIYPPLVDFVPIYLLFAGILTILFSFALSSTLDFKTKKETNPLKTTLN